MIFFLNKTEQENFHNFHRTDV